MAKPRVESILLNVVDVLQGISTQAGYETDFKEVHRVPVNPFSQPTFPMCSIVDVGQEKLDGTPVNFTSSMLHLEIWYWNDETADISQRANLISSDIEKALKVDIKRGNFAYDTEIVGNALMIAPDVFPYGGGLVKVDIKFRYPVGNPYG